jgi:hypothetical protein
VPSPQCDSDFRDLELSKDIYSSYQHLHFSEKISSQVGSLYFKFVCLEEKAFFIKYLSLYKKMLEKDMGIIYKTCITA